MNAAVPFGCRLSALTSSATLWKDTWPWLIQGLRLEQTAGRLGSFLSLSKFRRPSPPAAAEQNSSSRFLAAVPPGCAHGFYVLTESADFLYKCTDYYHPSSEVTLAWDDPTVGINWPTLDGTLPQVSEKDRHGIRWDALPLFSNEALRQL